MKAILGIDASTSHVGYALVNLENGDLLRAGCILPHGPTIFDKIDVAREGLKAAFKVAQAMGIEITHAVIEQEMENDASRTTMTLVRWNVLVRDFLRTELGLCKSGKRLLSMMPSTARAKLGLPTSPQEKQTKELVFEALSQTTFRDYSWPEKHPEQRYDMVDAYVVAAAAQRIISGGEIFVDDPDRRKTERRIGKAKKKPVSAGARFIRVTKWGQHL